MSDRETTRDELLIAIATMLEEIALPLKRPEAAKKRRAMAERKGDLAEAIRRDGDASRRDVVSRDWIRR